MLNYSRANSQLILLLATLFLVACTQASEPDPRATINTTVINTTPVVTTTPPVLHNSPTAPPTNVSDPTLPVVNPAKDFPTPPIITNHSSVHIEYVAGIEGVVSAFNIEGSLGYAGVGSELVIFDLEEGEGLIQISSIQLPSAIQDIQVVDDYAYLALGESGLWIVDVSEISTPKKVGTYAVPGFSNVLDFYQEHIYLATQSMGLWVIDVTTPTTPLKVGSFEFATQIRDVILMNGIGYVATTAWNGESFVGDSGVYVMDVSQPSALREIDFFDTNDAPAKQLSIEGDYLYILTGWDMVPGVDNRLRVVDITQIENMIETGNVVLGNFVLSNAATRDGYAYVTTQSCDYMNTGKCGGWLTIVDISNLNAPVELSGPGCADCGWTGLAQSITIMGSRVYIAAGNGGLRVYEVIHPGM